MRARALGFLLAIGVAGTTVAGGDHLATDAKPLETATSPDRPHPILELGDDFLGVGTISTGFRLPTGAVWQPSLLVFGTFRSAFQTESTETNSREWANRLDLFANLALTGTERILIGFRPIDDGGAFSGYDFDEDDGVWRSEWSTEIETLFFEGDLGQLFPNLDTRHGAGHDIGFSVGRQPLLFQEGFFIEDRIDAVGLTRNTLRSTGASNLRFTGLFGWGDTDRGADRPAASNLFALFTEFDRASSTINFDLAYVRDGRRDADSFHAALSTVQRLGRLNTAFRVLTSTNVSANNGARGSGSLVVAELSRTPPGSHDLVYLNGFWALGNYRPAARDPRSGGALARIGILFEGSGMDSFGSPVTAVARDSVGGSAGYQKLFHGGRRQLVAELAASFDTGSREQSEAAIGLRYQHAIGRRLFIRVDGFSSWRDGSRRRLGARLELEAKF